MSTSQYGIDKNKRALVVSKLKERAKKGAQGISGSKKLKSRQQGTTTASTTSQVDNNDYSDVEEEPQEEYGRGGYHRVKIGDTLKNNRYHVVSKLGWGYFSTVWLAFDHDLQKFVALKITKSKLEYLDAARDECSLLTDLANGEGEGKDRIVQLLDQFTFLGPNGKHFCLVMQVIGDNMLALIRSYDYKGLGLKNKLLPVICRDILMGAQYMHEQCKIIHTDLKPENILFERPTVSVLETMKKYKIPPKCGVPLAERDVSTLNKKQLKKLKRKMQQQEPQKLEESEDQETTNETQSTQSEESSNATNESEKESQSEDVSSSEKIVELEFTHDPYRVKIADFGNSCWVKKHFTTDIQTRQYRCPEVITGAGYSTPADIWSLACVFFELATGDFLFDPKHKDHGSVRYSRDEDHLAQMIELLGEMPKHLQFKGKNSHKFFTKHGALANIRDLKFWNLESVLMDKYRFEKEDAVMFANFLNPMLQFDPARRATAKQCLQHEFVQEERISQMSILSLEERLNQIPASSPRSEDDEESRDDTSDQEESVTSEEELTNCQSNTEQ